MAYGITQLCWRNQGTVRGVYCCGPSESTKTAGRSDVPCGGSVGRRLAGRRGAQIPEKLGDVSRHYLDAEDEGRHSRRVHLAAGGEGVRSPQYAEINSLRSIELPSFGRDRAGDPCKQFECALPQVLPHSRPAAHSRRGLCGDHQLANVLRRKNSAGEIVPAFIGQRRPWPSAALDGADQLLHLGRRWLQRRELAGEFVHRQHVLVAPALVLGHRLVERLRLNT